jgi:hypothetical protein
MQVVDRLGVMREHHDEKVTQAALNNTFLGITCRPKVATPVFNETASAFGRTPRKSAPLVVQGSSLHLNLSQCNRHPCEAENHGAR